MGAENFGTIDSAMEPIHEPVRQELVAKAATTGAPPAHLKIAERPVRSRVQRLLDLATSLARETESLARDRAFAEESNRLQGLNLAEGIDFYKEVERLRAADQARARSNARTPASSESAAYQPTTLNSKIKLYGIEY